MPEKNFCQFFQRTEHTYTNAKLRPVQHSDCILETITVACDSLPDSTDAM